MRRRICLAVGLVALAVPASGWAQSSSQAQYQGVAPETQIPVSGGGGTSGGGGATATPATGTGSTATGGGRPVSGGTGHATGGSKSSGGAATGTSQTGAAPAPAISLPAASTSTSPFGGSDILLIVLAIAGLTGLGLLLRRTTHRAPAA